jgi:hypothetical protein
MITNHQEVHGNSIAPWRYERTRAGQGGIEKGDKRKRQLVLESWNYNVHKTHHLAVNNAVMQIVLQRKYWAIIKIDAGGACFDRYCGKRSHSAHCIVGCLCRHGRREKNGSRGAYK